MVAKAIFKVFILDVKVPFTLEIETFRTTISRGFAFIQQLEKKEKAVTNEIGMFLTL